MFTPAADHSVCNKGIPVNSLHDQGEIMLMKSSGSSLETLLSSGAPESIVQPECKLRLMCTIKGFPVKCT